MWSSLPFTQSLVRRLSIVGAVRSGELVETLPFPEFDLKIDVTPVAEEVVKLLLARPMGSLDLAVQLG